MEIAITAKKPNLDAEIDSHFGHCQYLIIVDLETMNYGAIDNTSTITSAGCDISAAHKVIGMGIKAVLTGNCGPNTHQVLLDAGVQVFTGVSGNVTSAIADYMSGKLKPAPKPAVGVYSAANRRRGSICAWDIAFESGAFAEELARATCT
jgi:predicted Fe-Mo cluster-binding NifX family protein